MSTHAVPSTPPAIIGVDRLRYSYPGRHVFNGWSKQFSAGVTWLRGGNGSGKSTLLRLIGGALAPAAGTLVVNGVEQAAQPQAYRREVFWCGPGPVPFDHLSPIDYLAFMRSLFVRFDEQALASHLQGFGLEPQLHMPLRSLSTGTQRKVWLAAALSAGTAAALLDEPFNALDASSSAWLQESLLACGQDRERCLIVASHEALGGRLALSAVVELPDPAH